ncbi:MAG TPA: ABC transporter substrate-binding protein [Chloroflexota bacterium]|nr:ABC transporter substrate-binding protein [Chloroflexota bacterium]
MIRRPAAALAWLLMLGVALACARPAGSPSSGAAPATAAPASDGGRGETGASPAQSGAAAAPARAEAAPVATSGPREAIVFGIPQRNLNYIVPMAAKALGYFEQEGLDVDIRELQSNLTIAALQRGDMQISGSGGSALRAAVQGAPFKLISFMTVRPTFYLVTVPSVQAPAQLVGKRIGVNNVASSQQNFAEIYARESSVDPGEIIFMGMGPNPASAIAAIQAGALDGAVLDPASVAVAEAQGLRTLKALGEVAPQPLQGLVTTEDYLAQRPAVVRAFLKGLVRGLLYTKEHTREVAAVAQQELGLDLDEGMAQRAVALYADTISAEAPGYADAKLLDAFYHYDIRVPLNIPDDQPLPVLHDFRYLLEAYDALNLPRPR